MAKTPKLPSDSDDYVEQVPSTPQPASFLNDEVPENDSMFEGDEATQERIRELARKRFGPKSEKTSASETSPPESR